MYYDANLWVILARNPAYLYFGMLSYFRNGIYGRRFFFLTEKCLPVLTQSTLNYFITECFNYAFCTPTNASPADQRLTLLQILVSIASKKKYKISYWASVYYYRRQVAWDLVTEKYSLGSQVNNKCFDQMMLLVSSEIMNATS